LFAVASEIRLSVDLPLRTRDAVETETPAAIATLESVGRFLSLSVGIIVAQTFDLMGTNFGTDSAQTFDLSKIFFDCFPHAISILYIKTANRPYPTCHLPAEIARRTAGSQCRRPKGDAHLLTSLGNSPQT
jgi:hypothetical protein